MPELALLLLRHGEVASHRGDVPVTDGGLSHARTVGEAIGRRYDGPISLLYGGTRRSRETAEAIAAGIADPARVTGPTDSFALRNPDTYLAGTRVNMVSSAEALAEQVPGMTVQQAEANAWWTAFIESPDRIGWWLGQEDPPGENAAGLAARVLRFARSLADPGPMNGHLVVCATHSPLLRAVLQHATGADPGEPAYVTGARLLVDPSGSVDITAYDALA